MKKVGQGIGASGKEVLKIVKQADNIDFEKILAKVDNLQKREFLSNFKKEINICKGYTCPTTGFKPGQWLNHYTKHGSEFPYANVVDYLRGANNLKSRTTNSFILQKVDSKKILRKYNTTTNEFISLNPDGSFRTYFKPTDGINYWNKQPGK